MFINVSPQDWSHRQSRYEGRELHLHHEVWGGHMEDHGDCGGNVDVNVGQG